MKLVIYFLILITCVSVVNAQLAETIPVNDDIQLIQLQDSIFIHVTWTNSLQFGRVASNGMIIIKNGEAVMVDTPMEKETTRNLIEFLRDSLKVEVSKFIAGHFHNDCIGGIEYIHNNGIESIGNSLTIKKCNELGLIAPITSFTDEYNFNFNGLELSCRYFGGGHSFDNITVWMPEAGILFGGCLVKSIEARGLGNLSDAKVLEWADTIKKIMYEYPGDIIVVPGHGEAGGRDLLEHTIELVEEYMGVM